MAQSEADGPCPECGNEGNNHVHDDDYDRQCPKCGTFFNVEPDGSEQSNFPIEAKDGRVWIIGTVDHDNERIVQMGTTEVVPEGTIIGYHEPTFGEEYERKSTVTLSPEDARSLADGLNRMADKMEADGSEDTERDPQ